MMIRQSIQQLGLASSQLGTLVIKAGKGLFGKVVIIDGADHFFTGLLEKFVNLPLEYLYDRIVMYA